MVSVSRQTIVAIERGNYSPSVKLALLLARKLETTVEDLFELEEGDYDQTR
jgi:putative transcriptional regulator